MPIILVKYLAYLGAMLFPLTCRHMFSQLVRKFRLLVLKTLIFRQNPPAYTAKYSPKKGYIVNQGGIQKIIGIALPDISFILGATLY